MVARRFVVRPIEEGFVLALEGMGAWALTEPEALAIGQQLLEAVRKKSTDRDLAELTEEPKCEQCGVGVLRENCLYGLDASCPRHDQIEMLGGMSRLQHRLNELAQKKRLATD